MQAAGVLLLILFAATLIGLYLAVRRALAPTLYLATAGVALSVALVIAFAFTNENVYTAQAVLAGLVVGLGFAGAVVAIASFFRVNEPPDRVTLVSDRPAPSDRPAQEEPSHGSTDHDRP